MDPVRFDALTLGVGAEPSRRGLLRLVGTGAMAALVSALNRPEGVGALCKSDGGKCRRGPECCSGTCQGKKKKKRRCRAAPGALGCTIDDPYATPCPNSSDPNHFCWVTLANKPFCGTSLQCFACASDDDCVSQFGNASARCVKFGPEAGCQAYNNRSCIVFP
jgi:hypothetical protein